MMNMNAPMCKSVFNLNNRIRNITIKQEHTSDVIKPLKETYYGVFPTYHSKWVPENMFLKLIEAKKILPTAIPLCFSPFRMCSFWCL